MVEVMVKVAWHPRPSAHPHPSAHFHLSAHFHPSAHFHAFALHVAAHADPTTLYPKPSYGNAYYGDYIYHGYILAGLRRPNQAVLVQPLLCDELRPQVTPTSTPTPTPTPNPNPNPNPSPNTNPNPNPSPNPSPDPKPNPSPNPPLTTTAAARSPTWSLPSFCARTSTSPSRTYPRRNCSRYDQPLPRPQP